MSSFIYNLTSYTRTAASGLRYVKDLRLSLIRKVFSLMGKKEKIAFSLLTAVALVNFFFSSRSLYARLTVPAPGFGGTYTEGIVGQPQYINPILASQGTDTTITRLVYSGLYRYDKDGAVVPDLAEGFPTISEDQKQYTVKLRHDIEWHNGLPFNADDVVYTLSAVQNEAYRSPQRELWLSTAVEKISDYEVKFTTKDVSGPFIHHLTLPLLPKSVWENLAAQDFLASAKNIEAVGTGPYEIKEIKRLTKSGKIQQMTLTANRDRVTNRPHIETLVLKFFDTEQDALNALHSKEIEGVGFEQLHSNLHMETNLQDVTMYELPLPQYQMVFFNTQHPILSDKEIRNALALATNRTEIIETVFLGDASQPSWPLGSSVRPQEFNLVTANTKLDQLGWVLDPTTNVRMKKNVKLEFAIVTNENTANVQAAQVLAQQWKAVGVQATVNSLPTKQLSENNIRTRNYDILVFPQKFGADPDPFAFWHSSQVKDPGLNITGYQNPAMDKLITEARTTTNQQTRMQKYQELYTILQTEVPVLFLTQTQYAYAVHTKIKGSEIGMLYDPSFRSYSMPEWYITESRNWK